jgi:hypothetical protein
MQKEEMIIIDEFCIHHNIDIGFINSLQDSGLIKITHNDEKLYLPESQLSELEKMVRLFYELDINLEGIETITYLLTRMNQMQREIIRLNNRLSVYESD